MSEAMVTGAAEIYEREVLGEHITDADYGDPGEPKERIDERPALVTVDVYFWVFDSEVSPDGAFLHDRVFASTYKPDPDRVLVGKSIMAFTPLAPAEIVQGKLEGLESALNLYRAKSLAEIERMQGKINEFKALEVLP